MDNYDPVIGLTVHKMTIPDESGNPHHVEVTPPKEGVINSALFYCRDCRTGFHKAAVRGQYSSPQPCPVMKQIWNGLRPAWRRWMDRRIDTYLVIRHIVKQAMRRVLYG